MMLVNDPLEKNQQVFTAFEGVFQVKFNRKMLQRPLGSFQGVSLCKIIDGPLCSGISVCSKTIKKLTRYAALDWFRTNKASLIAEGTKLGNLLYSVHFKGQ